MHCYLTRPFVASWSLLDAMASGCNIVASDTKPVRELAHSSATTWVDHRNQTDLLNGLEQALRVTLEERHEEAVAAAAGSGPLESPAISSGWQGLLEI